MLETTKCILMIICFCYFSSAFLLPPSPIILSHVPLAPDAATAGKPMPGKVESPQLYKPWTLMLFGLRKFM